MSEESISHLGSVANRILEVQREFMKLVADGISHLKKLPEYFEGVKKEINTGVSRVIQSRAEMEIYIKMAQISSKQSLVSAENEAIGELKEQLTYDYNEIDKRYSKIQHELSEECSRRVREIDEAMFAIIEKFPISLYTNYENEVMPFYNNLLADSKTSYEERLFAIAAAVNRSIEEINKFINIRKDFLNDLKEYQLPAEGNSTSTLHVPVWLVELEDTETGSVLTKAFLPGEAVLTTNDLENGSFSIIANPSVTPYSAVIEDTTMQKYLGNQVSWSSDAKVKNELKQDLEKYLNKKYPEKYAQVKTAMLNTIEESEFKSIKF